MGDRSRLRSLTARGVSALGATAIAALAVTGSAAAAAFGPSGGITINDGATATPYPSTIDVSGLSGTITDVDVTLNGLGHGHPTDVDILLAGPGGGALEVLSDVPADDDQGLGACDAAAGIDLTFSDQAAGKLPGDQPLTTGTYRPTDYALAGVPGECGGGGDSFPSAPAPTGTTLDIFNGTNPNGTWSLYVTDDSDGDTGTIAGGWSIAITTTTPTPTPCTIPTGTPADYDGEILADSPAAYWRLGESSGTTSGDASPNNRDGIYAGDHSLGAPGALATDTDTAVELTSRSGRITTTYSPFARGSARSYEGWACRDTVDLWDVLFSGSKVGVSPGLYTRPTDPQRLLFDPRMQGGTAAVSWPAALPVPGEWFHWVLNFDDAANLAELFVDGQSRGTRTVTEPYHSTPGAIRLGNYGSTDRDAWDGALDEVAVYEGALSATEVCAHYEAGTGAASCSP